MKKCFIVFKEQFNDRDIEWDEKAGYYKEVNMVAIDNVVEVIYELETIHIFYKIGRSKWMKCFYINDIEKITIN